MRRYWRNMLLSDKWFFVLLGSTGSRTSLLLLRSPPNALLRPVAMNSSSICRKLRCFSAIYFSTSLGIFVGSLTIEGNSRSSSSLLFFCRS